MTRLRIDHLEAPDHSLEEILESPTIIPRRIGSCSNQIAREEYCGRGITDQDVEAVELPPEAGVRKFACGSCVEYLLHPPIRERMLDDPRRLKAPETKVRDFQRRPSKVERAI